MKYRTLDRRCQNTSAPNKKILMSRFSNLVTRWIFKLRPGKQRAPKSRLRQTHHVEQKTWRSEPFHLSYSRTWGRCGTRKHICKLWAAQQGDWAQLRSRKSMILFRCKAKISEWALAGARGAYPGRQSNRSSMGGRAAMIPHNKKYLYRARRSAF